MKEPPIENETIVQQLRKGDEKAIKMLYRLAYPECASYIKQNSGTTTDAEDIFQESVMVLFRKIKAPDFQLSSHIKTFLYAILKNLWRNELRKRTRSGLKLTIDDASENPFPLKAENEVALKQEEEKKHELIAQTLQSIEGNCREVLINFYFKKMSLKEIGAAMGFTEQYAKKRRYTCMESLKKKVKAQYQDMA